MNLPEDLRLDYGAGGHDLGMIHRFSLSWRFGGFFAKSQASPEVFSPLGTKSATQFALNARTRNEVESWRLEISDKTRQHRPQIRRPRRAPGPPDVGRQDRSRHSPARRILPVPAWWCATWAAWKSSGPARPSASTPRPGTISVPVQVSGK